MAKKNPSTEPEKEQWPIFGVRIPKEVAKKIRVQAAIHELEHGEFIVQLMYFAQKNGFYDWLTSNADKS